MHSSDVTRKIRQLSDERERISLYFNRMKNEFHVDDYTWMGNARNKYHSNSEIIIDKHKAKLLSRLSDLENELYRYRRTLEIEEERRAERIRRRRLEELTIE